MKPKCNLILQSSWSDSPSTSLDTNKLDLLWIRDIIICNQTCVCCIFRAPGPIHRVPEESPSRSGSGSGVAGADGLCGGPGISRSVRRPIGRNHAILYRILQKCQVCGGCCVNMSSNVWTWIRVVKAFDPRSRALVFDRPSASHVWMSWQALNPLLSLSTKQ